MISNVDANISHSFYYNTSVFKNTDDFFNAVLSDFPEALKYDSSSSFSQSYIQDMQVCESFLSGGSQTYIANRIFLEDIKPDLELSGLSGWCVMITFFPEVSQVCISFHYSLKNTNTNHIIVLRQSGEHRKYMFGTSEKSISEIAGEICLRYGIINKAIERSFLCEITKFDNITDISEIEQSHYGILYGILSGDEGYSFVPKDLIMSRLKYNWGSRDFIRIYAFGQGFLFLNMIEGESRARYLDYQHEFGTAAYGSCNPYFDIGSSPLTVNHGILFSVEYVMILKALTDSVITYQNDSSQRVTDSFYSRIRESRSFRRKIIVVLERAESIEISEIGELSSVLIESQHIAPVVGQVKYLLELLESDLDLMYSERNNLLITSLTVLGLFFAALQVILSFF